MLYVVGGGEENEVLLFSVILCLRDALGILLKLVLPPHPFSCPPLPATPPKRMSSEEKKERERAH